MNVKNKNRFIAFIFVSVLFISSCRKDLPISRATCFPPEINRIIQTNCAVSGCHTDASKNQVEGLSLESWDKLFEGGEHGAEIVPYDPERSPLFLFMNTYSSLGTTEQDPKMPFGKPALSYEDVLKIKNWILSGAPDCGGFVKFSDNPNRRKIYVTNQGCDLVAVIDEETNLVMRYIKVGADPVLIESPHTVRVSPDGKYWYVMFFTGNVIQKYSAADDKKVGELNIGSGNWAGLMLSPDGTKAIVSDLSPAPGGKIVVVDLTNMTLLKTWSGFDYPHGLAFNKDFSVGFLTAQYGNRIYKLDLTTLLTVFLDVTEVVLDNSGNPPSSIPQYDPHEMIYSPDEIKYFVTCQLSNEVRVMDAATDTLIALIPIGDKPQEMSISESKGLLFATCMEDTTSFPGLRGSVAIINYNTNTLVNKIYTGWQPHGIDVDDVNGFVYVANRNVTPGGPAPHHTSDCGGTNGYVTLINMNTLELVPNYKIELTPDSYFVAVRP